MLGRIAEFEKAQHTTMGIVRWTRVMYIYSLLLQ